MTKEKPWWKQTPVAAPDAPRAVRPPPEDPDGGEAAPAGTVSVFTNRVSTSRSITSAVVN